MTVIPFRIPDEPPPPTQRDNRVEVDDAMKQLVTDWEADDIAGMAVAMIGPDGNCWHFVVWGRTDDADTALLTTLDSLDERMRREYDER